MRLLWALPVCASASMGDMADSWFASMSSPAVAPVCRGSHAEACCATRSVCRASRCSAAATRAGGAPFAPPPRQFQLFRMAFFKLFHGFLSSFWPLFGLFWLFFLMNSGSVGLEVPSEERHLPLWRWL